MVSAVNLYRPENVTDTNSNGGRMTYNPVVTTVGGAGNLPTITRAEQASGVTKLRKVFAKVDDGSNPAVVSGLVFLKKPSELSDSRSFLIKGTQRDQQSAIATRRYATGWLNANVNAGATALVVDFETGSGADNVVQAGDRLAIIEGTTENLDLTVDSVVWTGDQAAITLTTGVLNNFTTNAAVASVIVDTVNVNPRFDNVVKSFSTSTFDETTYPILTNNLGTDEQTVTLTFTSATEFSVLSDKHGTLASGTVSTDYAPVNSLVSEPYFVIQAAAWGGTHTVGETLQFQVHPAAIPVWVGQQVYAGAGTGTDTTFFSVRLEA